MSERKLRPIPIPHAWPTLLTPNIHPETWTNASNVIELTANHVPRLRFPKLLKDEMHRHFPLPHWKGLWIRFSTLQVFNRPSCNRSAQPASVDGPTAYTWPRIARPT